ncbi:hypothetical protein GQ44DRAFT_657310 [Phaeosphaeriaceae sp. PMI808]|nr:hypothetical protein GQ44DRAFT_657310 [Phaeosphaeriaceae sp. PMI808]
MVLVKLQDGPSQWTDIKEAAQILSHESYTPDVNVLRAGLQNHFVDPILTVVDLHTGFNAGRKAVLVNSHERITVAFTGSGSDGLWRNTWANAKGPNFWDIPYAVYTDGNRVHSFFRDMWHAMRSATFHALSQAVDSIVAREAVPRQIIITGFSMGGGVSTMAFTDILEYVRSTYGSESHSPQTWASDNNLSSLFQHLTFAAVAAADQGFHTILNYLYERHQIRAWDFMNHMDWTRHFHDWAFRSWRGHRYIFPDAVVRQYKAEFGPQNHFLLGYLKAVEWMERYGTDQVKSEYTY